MERPEREVELDSEGVYLGMSLADFGVRVSGSSGDPADSKESKERPRGESGTAV